jgi:8-oxo-dGTP pyrophosphatase MutT (NUDIX family)
MAPRPRTSAQHNNQLQPEAKVNGVLILFYPFQNEIYLPLILRPIYRGVHSGQVSLPGGRKEPGDSDVVDTALREAEEEIGVNSACVRILGQISPVYIGASNNIVYPSVGWIDSRPDFTTDRREVALLIEAPLSALLNPSNIRSESRQLNGRSVDVPYYRVCGQSVWGATAMILGELLALPSVKSWQSSPGQP